MRGPVLHHNIQKLAGPLDVFGLSFQTFLEFIAGQIKTFHLFGVGFVNQSGQRLGLGHGGAKRIALSAGPQARAHQGAKIEQALFGRQSAGGLQGNGARLKRWLVRIHITNGPYARQQDRAGAADHIDKRIPKPPDRPTSGGEDHRIAKPIGRRSIHRGTNATGQLVEKICPGRHGKHPGAIAIQKIARPAHPLPCAR